LAGGGGGEVTADHHGVAAQGAHHDLGLVRLAAFAMPALDQLVWACWIGLQPKCVEAFTVQLEFVPVGGPVATRWAGR